MAGLTDKPVIINSGWKGYFHHIDPTLQDFSSLTYPSQNCSIPTFDKIIPDKGKTLLGSAYTENVGIIGNKKKFKNMGGIELEVRVWPSQDANLKDVIEIGWQNDKMLLSGVVGTFDIGETIVGGTSTATGEVVAIRGDILTLDNITGVFAVGETVTGNSSSATGTTVVIPQFIWQQITENVNPHPSANQEYYFDEWFDTSTDASVSKRVPRLIWVNGYYNPAVTKKGAIYSWTGGVAMIENVTGTNLEIDSSITWRSLGFTEDANGDAFIVVNGTEYELVTPADLDTNSIELQGGTAGISLGDIATSQIEVDLAPIPFNMTRQNKNYMFYGNWDNRDFYQSNAFNRPFDFSDFFLLTLVLG